MVFSNAQILEALQTGHIMVYPLVPAYIKGSSVDVTLGNNYYITDRIDNSAGYNPFDRDDVGRYFDQPQHAMAAGAWSERHKGLHWEGIPDDHPIIVLQPHQRILAHTHEFIGINPPGTTEMRARSTWGRNGIVVCKDAGWGDPGYINRWTMEFQNDNDEMVVLPVGERVAQIIFHQTGPVDGHYGVGGKYQGGKRLSEVVRDWTPEAMLPRAYLDERKKPLPLDPVEVENLEKEIMARLAAEETQREVDAKRLEAQGR